MEKTNHTKFEFDMSWDKTNVSKDLNGFVTYTKYLVNIYASKVYQTNWFDMLTEKKNIW